MRRVRTATPRSRAHRWPADGPFLHRAGRFLVGWLLVPAIIGLFSALLRAMTSVPGSRTVLSLDAGVFAFLVGMGAFCLAYVFLPRPTRAYVVAHELTHALFARLHGSRVGAIDIQDDRGSIRISQPNTMTLLAPYFFPLYTVLLIGIVTLAAVLFPRTDIRIPALGLIGLSWGFHFCFTVNSLLQHQTDIERCGYLYSYTLILFLNLVVLAVGLVAATPLTVIGFLGIWKTEALRAFATLGSTLVRLHDRAWSWVK